MRAIECWGAALAAEFSVSAGRYHAEGRYRSRRRRRVASPTAAREASIHAVFRARQDMCVPWALALTSLEILLLIALRLK